MTSSKPGLERFDGLHPHRVVGRRIVVSRRTVSTQEDARRLARSLGEDAHGLVVTTLEQTGGRGTRGRTWWSPPGTSLALSFVWSPSPPLARPAALTLAAAMAVLRAGEAVSATLAIRWPNDVVTPAGAKVAGVLAETTSGSRPVHVVGIGVNVLEPAAPPPVSIERPWASLEAAGAAGVTPDGFFLGLLERLEESLAALDDAGMAELARAFQERSWLRGRFVTLRRGDDQRDAVFRELSPTLELTFDTADGTRERWPGEQVDLLGWR